MTNLSNTEIQRRKLREITATMPTVDNNGNRIDKGRRIYKYNDEGEFIGAIDREDNTTD